MNKEVILALDISSKSTGWAVFEGESIKDYGLIQIPDKKSWGYRLSLFKENLTDIINKHKPHKIIVEDIYRGASYIAFRVLAMWHGVAYEVCNSIAMLEPIMYKVMTVRGALGSMGEVTCRTKEEAFLIMNSTLKLKLEFDSGNDIADACALAYTYFFKTKKTPSAKINFNKKAYSSLGEKKNVKRSVQGPGIKKKRLKRGSKKSVQKVSKKVPSRSKSKQS